MSETMKVTLVQVGTTCIDEIPAFIKEINECEDTAALLKEGCEGTFTIAAVGVIAMDYAMSLVERYFGDYSSKIIK